MATGQLFLRPQKQGEAEKAKVMNIEREVGKGSPKTTSKNGKGEQKKIGGKKKKGKGSGDDFRVHGNTINGGKADKCGVFGFGNKYIGSKKPKDDESSEDESESSDEDVE